LLARLCGDQLTDAASRGGLWLLEKLCGFRFLVFLGGFCTTPATRPRRTIAERGIVCSPPPRYRLRVSKARTRTVLLRNPHRGSIFCWRKNGNRNLKKRPTKPPQLQIFGQIQTHISVDYMQIRVR
jgi:hypothetical protein